MPTYRDPAKPSNLYEVIKVQTCSGQLLETKLSNIETTSRNRLLVTNPETIFF